MLKIKNFYTSVKNFKWKIINAFENFEIFEREQFST